MGLFGKIRFRWNQNLRSNALHHPIRHPTSASKLYTGSNRFSRFAMSNQIRSLLVALSALLLSGTCLAQGTGVIYGTVTDPSGAGVAGAKVEAFLIGRGTTRAGAASASGEYVFPAMPIGAWEIRVTAAGFQQFRRQPVTLDANQNVRVDATLTVGSISESVTVNDEAPL